MSVSIFLIFPLLPDVRVQSKNKLGGTVRADSLNVRSGPQLYDFVKSVKAGEVVQATERALISGDPWFHISDGWISGKYV